MLDAILKATNSSFQKDVAFCHSINLYMKKFMKLLAFIFEHPSYRGAYTSAHVYLNL